MKATQQEKQKALEDILKPYLTTGILDLLSSENNNDCSTYYATFRPQIPTNNSIFSFTPVIVKELDSARVSIYQMLYENKSPYRENIMGFLTVGNITYSLQNCITPPVMFQRQISSISLSMEALIEKKLLQRPLTEPEALTFLYELCEGLKDVHKNNCFHGDISPQNIVFTNRTTKMLPPFTATMGIHYQIMPVLIDFGNTKENKENNHQVTTILGTKPYAAPDVLDFHYPINQRADIYSLGCILGYLLTGFSPKEQNLQPLISPRMWKLILNCTAGYEDRFQDISQLQQYILKEICGIHFPIKKQPFSFPIKKLLSYVPGFRSNKTLNIAIASYAYFSMILGIFAMTLAGLFSKACILAVLFLVAVISILDIFHLKPLLRKKIPYFKVHEYILNILWYTTVFFLNFMLLIILGQYL